MLGILTSFGEGSLLGASEVLYLAPLLIEERFARPGHFVEALALTWPVTENIVFIDFCQCKLQG